MIVVHASELPIWAQASLLALLLFLFTLAIVSQRER